MRTLLVSLNREQLPSPVVPLGLLSVAASTRLAHSVQVIDLCFQEHPDDALAAAIRSFSPEVVGLGLRNLHDNAYRSTHAILAEYDQRVATVRQITSAPVVLGGAGFSLRPKELLARFGVEHGVVGEAERTFPWLLSRLERGQNAPSLVDPSVLVAEGLSAFSELDALPLPARDLLDPRHFLLDGTANVQTKRGCVFHCAYCDYPDLEGRFMRQRNPAHVADEVLALSRLPNVEFLFFVDSVFNVPRKHALEICKELSSRGSPLPWVAYVSPVSLDDELVAAMARAGCIGVELGSDSGSEEGLARLRKPFRLSDIQTAHDLFRKHGIPDCHTFVVGAFSETAEDVQKTLDFVSQLDPDVAVFIVFQEDREAADNTEPPHRQSILELLERQAATHPGWVVPELDVRLSAKLARALRRMRFRGPAWLHLATARRRLHSRLSPKTAL